MSSLHYKCLGPNYTSKNQDQLQHDLIALKALLIFFSKIHYLRLIRVILIVKVNWKRKNGPYTAISFNKANLIEMTT